ncbi:hypothetical protein [Arcticibacterium luteifluviistationis]|uniref:Uncharacterized protein n=1 Tax=Arcticibacterium luteifluviistationis TaxID=1784714 RepID=A0A2Z4GD95_9BACT|nr:hypothetical protein [Arcticibacterium luteifluviistationis]AWV99087.1 hypothetical protein DJ013_13290 [Arcticibacterium luteifluviistationis]
MKDTLYKIIIGLEELILNDKWLLLNDLSEQSISHKFAEKLTSLFEGYDVDCEYNGNCESEGGRKRIEVLAKELKELNEKERLEFEKSEKKGDLVFSRRVFPDVIIHKRGGNGSNLCIIEVKKSSSPSGLYKYDKLKLEKYTDDNYGNEFKYDLGLFVELKTGKDFSKDELGKNYKLELFQNGENITEN